MIKLVKEQIDKEDLKDSYDSSNVFWQRPQNIMTMMIGEVPGNMMEGL